nr:hypothetical protein [Pandoravirus massiliensis]
MIEAGLSFGRSKSPIRDARRIQTRQNIGKKDTRPRKLGGPGHPLQCDRPRLLCAEPLQKRKKSTTQRSMDPCGDPNRFMNAQAPTTTSPKKNGQHSPVRLAKNRVWHEPMGVVVFVYPVRIPRRKKGRAERRAGTVHTPPRRWPFLCLYFYCDIVFSFFSLLVHSGPYAALPQTSAPSTLSWSLLTFCQTKYGTPS